VPNDPGGRGGGAFSPQNRAAYPIMWKYNAEPGRPQTTIWHMRVVCWIPKVTNTHPEYVVLIAFLLQQWLHERSLLLSYTYIACLII